MTYLRLRNKKIISLGFLFKWGQENLLLKSIDLYVKAENSIKSIKAVPAVPWHENFKNVWNSPYQMTYKIQIEGKHFATCTVALSGLTLFSDMYGSSWYLWIVCTSFATCTVPAKYALPFFGTCTVETPARKCYYIQPYWIAIWRHYLNYSSLGLTKIKTNMAGKHYLELSDSILKACYKVQTLFYFYLFISFQYFVRLGLVRLGLG